MKLNFTILAVCILFCTGCGDTPKEAKKKEVEVNTTPEKKEPKSTFENLDGSPVELSDYKGHRVLVNYWATWCRPCIEEMPSLLKAQAILGKEGYIFRLASDQSLEKIKAFDEKKKFDFVYLKFNGSLAEQQISALPATLIYNALGEQVDRIDGATDWESPEIIERLKAVK